MRVQQPTDVRVEDVSLYFLPITLRVPLQFGREMTRGVTCSRAAVTVKDGRGRTATGWGETPLNVQWVWPSALPAARRDELLCAFSVELARAWRRFPSWGHPVELGYRFMESALGELSATFSDEIAGGERLPRLAALVAFSPFDIACHDAFGKLHGIPTYHSYGPDYLNRDLSTFLEPAPETDLSFSQRYLGEFLASAPPRLITAWHLVGMRDPLTEEDLHGDEPQDGYPLVLRDWIRRDGLTCLKIKLCGSDLDWDMERLYRVGVIARAEGVKWLSADFNCTAPSPTYVIEVLDRVRREAPDVFDMLLYIEQPFPYDLANNQLDVSAVSGIRPLFMDESAHDWRLVRLGRSLGWSGVALKTCKTQTGALLSLAWARAHGMEIMVQDLTNPMLAQIPHVLLAAHAATMMGVETNAMQFYPDASQPEAAVHPGLYRRRGGVVDLSSIRGPGFGYRLEEIGRTLPERAE
jgi:L-alanine-DL-glutamate epimerase-like enolase superfamily enzyme